MADENGSRSPAYPQTHVARRFITRAMQHEKQILAASATR